MKTNIALFFSTAVLILLFTSCGENLTSEKLLGKWNYVKVESLHHLEEDLSDEEVAENAPSITFSKNGDLVIIWGKEVLSKGKFKVEGDIIRYTESLPNGVTRPIPYLVKKLDENNLVFETMEEQATRITARKDAAAGGQ
jgi:hypothetical protein